MGVPGLEPGDTPTPQEGCYCSCPVQFILHPASTGAGRCLPKWWTARESNPVYLGADQVYYRPTRSPLLVWVQLEGGTGAPSSATGESSTRPLFMCLGCVTTNTHVPRIHAFLPFWRLTRDSNPSLAPLTTEWGPKPPREPLEWCRPWDSNPDCLGFEPRSSANWDRSAWCPV